LVANAIPAEDFAPTSIANLAPVTTGDGTDHAARLVVWGSLRTRLEKNMLIEVEVLSVPEEDPDAAWLM
jgi:hypothetical protein